MIDTVKVGFLGFGNMAQAMAEGFLLGNALPPEHIFACAKSWDKLRQNTEPRGIIPCRDTADAVERSDILIAAVKPYLIEEVLSPLRDKLKGKILLSVAAGWDFERFEALLGPEVHHLSTMPNTPVSVGEGIVLLEERHSLNEEEYRLVVKLLSTLGVVQAVPGSQLGIAGTISGCGPAFASLFIEALGDAGVLHGLPRELAYRLASQMLAGTGKLQLATGRHPGAMKDAVCSPSGTTIVGVSALERSGLRSAVIDAVDAIQKK